MNNYVVEKDRIIHNIEIIKKHACGRIIYAVLKDNAYGLGLDMVAEVLLDQGIRHFAVTESCDAVRIREKSGDAGILLLSPVSDESEILLLVENRITMTISSSAQAQHINSLCRNGNLIAEAHIVVDTGMGRYGFLENEFEQIESVCRELCGIKITGIYTHAYNSPKSKDTERQIAMFSALLSRLSEDGVCPGTAHLASSVVLFKYGNALFDAVRVGSAIAGRLIIKEKFGLERVGYIESHIRDIRILPKGRTVGYGGIYRTKRPVTTAVIPVGYLHGFCVEKTKDTFRFKDTVRYILSDLKDFILGKKHYVSINGNKARVIGRIGTNFLVADVGGIDCSVGDGVLLEASPLISGNLLNIVYR